VETVSQVMFGKIGGSQRWGLVLDRYNHRIIWFERGGRLAHYDPDMKTVGYYGDLPAAMTTANCEDYRLIDGTVLYQPQRQRA
jgi:hypothetical protein